MVGDAAGFIDPLYSPGLDFCSYTSYYAADLLARSLKGEDVTERLHYYNQQYPVINLTLMLLRPVIRANEGSAGIHTQVSTATASTGAGSSALS